jgi:hypothetical protein
MEIEDGEVSDEPLTGPDKEAVMAAIKARLVADLDEVPPWEELRAPPPAADEAAEDSVVDLVNRRATVNMILTVVGEFYGQRDLLAFRDPFGGVPCETSPEEE